MPVIHASDVSEEATLIGVMDAPTLPGAATTRLGNSLTAASATRHAAAADCRRNATRSLPLRPTRSTRRRTQGTLAMISPSAEHAGANTRVSPPRTPGPWQRRTAPGLRPGRARAASRRAYARRTGRRFGARYPRSARRKAHGQAEQAGNQGERQKQAQQRHARVIAVGCHGDAGDHVAQRHAQQQRRQERADDEADVPCARPFSGRGPRNSSDTARTIRPKSTSMTAR